MKKLIRWWNRNVRYRTLYRELREAEQDLAEFQAKLGLSRARLKAEIEALHEVKDRMEEK